MKAHSVIDLVVDDEIFQVLLVKLSRPSLHTARLATIDFCTPLQFMFVLNAALPQTLGTDRSAIVTSFAHLDHLNRCNRPPVEAFCGAVLDLCKPTHDDISQSTQNQTSTLSLLLLLVLLMSCVLCLYSSLGGSCLQSGERSPNQRYPKSGERPLFHAIIPSQKKTHNNTLQLTVNQTFIDLSYSC